LKNNCQPPKVATLFIAILSIVLPGNIAYFRSTGVLKIFIFIIIDRFVPWHQIYLLLYLYYDIMSLTQSIEYKIMALIRMLKEVTIFVAKKIA
jgi:hypothetical protein